MTISIIFFFSQKQGELGASEADDEALNWDDVEDDGLAPRVAKDVYTPTAQEMEELCATHIPAKAWCPACVGGKLANAPMGSVKWTGTRQCQKWDWSTHSSGEAKVRTA